MRPSKSVPSVVSSVVTVVALAAIGMVAAGVSYRDARTVASVMAEASGYSQIGH